MQIGFLALLLLTTLFQGGREIAGLVVYQIVSILIFLFVLRNSSIRKTSIDTPLILFLLICGISTLYSIITRMRGMVHFSTLIIHAMNFYSLAQIREEKFSRNFLILFTCICAFLSLGVLFQNVILKVDRTSFLPNVNLLSEFLICGVAVIFCKIIFDESVWRSRTQRAVWLGFILIILSASLSVFSAGAFISLAFALLLLTSVNLKKFIVPVLSLAAISLAILLFFPRNTNKHILEKFVVKVTHISENSRAVVWRGALQSFLKKPLLGWGVGSFGEVYQLNKLPMEKDIGRYEKTTRFAHNEFLDMAVETGLAGLCLFIWIVLRILISGLRTVRNSAVTDWKYFSALSLFSIILFQSLFDFGLHLPVISLLFIFSAAILIRENNAVHQNDLLSFGPFPRATKIVQFVLVAWVLTDGLVLGSHCCAKIGDKKNSEGHAPGALFYYKMATTLNPFYGENLKNLASLSEPTEQERLLKRAIRFNPGNDSFHAELARHYMRQKRYDESMYEYEQAIQKNPKNPFHYSELADLFLQLNRAEAAQKLYRLSVQIEPLYVFAHFRLGEIALLLEQKSVALAAFNNVLKIKEYGITAATDYSRRLTDFDYSLAEQRIKEIKKMKRWAAIDKHE